MPQIRLVPSTYSFSNTSYMSIQNAANMYNNTDNTSYATVTHSNAATTTYYIYLKGFNFSLIDPSWIINSFTVKLKAYEKSLSTSTSYAPKLVNNTTTLTSTCAAVSASEQTLTFSGVGADFDTIRGYGSNFGIRVSVRRSSRNTQGYLYIYGAEILVDYTIPVYHTLTATLNGEGTITPSGSSQVLEGTTQTISVTPNDASAEVSATDNGNPVTLTKRTVLTSASSVIQNYEIVTGSFGSGENCFSGAVGKGYDTSSSTTNSGYSSGSSGSTVTIQYGFNLSDVPQGATNIRVRCRIKGHPESLTQNSERCDCQLYSGNTAKGTMRSFKDAGTSSPSVMELDDTGSWTRAELENLQLRVIIGYYGGAIDGATIDVEYDAGGESYYYTYDIVNVTGDHIVVVTIGTSSEPVSYIKINGEWKEVQAVYKKVGGVWQSVSDLTTLDQTKTWVRGEL